MGAIDVVAEGNESIGYQRHATQLVQPVALLLIGESRRDRRKAGAPAFLFGVCEIVAQVLVDRVVAVYAIDARAKGERQDRWMLAQPPAIGFVGSQPCAVDARLLACAI